MKKVTNWTELSKVPESPTHSLLIEGFSGWIIEKLTGERTYLSTHTFYERDRAYRTKLLQSCGFDIELCAPDKQSVVQRERSTLLS